MLAFTKEVHLSGFILWVSHLLYIANVSQLEGTSYENGDLNRKEHHGAIESSVASCINFRSAEQCSSSRR